MNDINWKLRRRAVDVTLLHYGLLLIYLLVLGEGESLLHSTIVSNSLILIVTVLGGYVFGGSVDTHANGPVMDSEGNEVTTGVNTNLGVWHVRRKRILLSMAIMTCGIDYLAIYGLDSTLNNTFATGLSMAYIAIINSWIFGSVYDDYAIKSKLSGDM